MGLEATPLDLAFASNYRDVNADAELRHKRRERIVDQPPSTRKSVDFDNSVNNTVQQKQKKRKTVYDMECNQPATDMSQTGPRCNPASRTKGDDISCPHCLQVLNIEPDSPTSSSYLSYGQPQNTPMRSIVDDMRPYYVNSKDSRVAAPVSQPQPPSQSIPSSMYIPIPEPIAQLIRSAANIPSEVFYAMVILIIILLVAMADRQHRR
jgi:hypothetical protein